MSLFIRVDCSFFRHRKTIRLRSLIGESALWVPPALWAYAAEHQPDGDFSSFSDAELAIAIGYPDSATSIDQAHDKYTPSIRKALTETGFMDPDGRIHGWEEHNGYHRTFAERARMAAHARWDKERNKEKEKKGDREERRREEQAEDKRCSSIATSNTQASKPNHYHKDSRTVLHILNEAAGVHFREVDSNLSVISARLNEPEVTLEGVRQMIQRQCKRWKGTSQAEYLRPETLFAKSKFDSYYASRDLPINSDNGKPGPGHVDRNAGTANEGKAHLYSLENRQKLGLVPPQESLPMPDDDSQMPF